MPSLSRLGLPRGKIFIFFTNCCPHPIWHVLEELFGMFWGDLFFLICCLYIVTFFLVSLRSRKGAKRNPKMWIWVRMITGLQQLKVASWQHPVGRFPCPHWRCPGGLLRTSRRREKQGKMLFKEFFAAFCPLSRGLIKTVEINLWIGLVFRQKNPQTHLPQTQYFNVMSTSCL